MLKAGSQPTFADDIRRGLAAIVSAVLIVMGAMLFTGFVVDLMRNASGGAAKLSNTGHWLAMVSFQAAMIALAIVVAGLYGPARETLALRFGSGLLRRAALPLIVSAGLMALYSISAMALFPDAVTQDLSVFLRLLADVPPWLPPIVLVVGAPLSEELVFRGYLLGQLRQTRIGFVGAAVISTFGWTLLHLSYTIVGLIDVFLAGLLFSWSLWRTGTLWVPIGFHALYNAIVLVVISTTMAQPA